MNDRPLLETGLPPLRIGLVTETYPPEINGVALTVARWVEGLRQRGHAVHLTRVRQHAQDQAKTQDGLDHLPLPGFSLPGYPQLRAGWPASTVLLRHWQQWSPDVIHIATEGPLGYSALRAARRLEIPVSTSFHTHFEGYSRHYHLGWLARPILAYLRHFHNQGVQTLVPTAELARQLEALGFRRTQVLARGVDTQLFSPKRRDPSLRARWNAAPDTVVALCVGRLAAEKNLELTIAAYAALRRQQPTARLVLVGDGPLTPRLQTRYPDVVYCGMQHGEALAAHYASADLFLFPSLTETFGNVVLEAMASGLALVAFDYAAAHAMVDSGQNGWRVPCGDEAAFIAATLALAEDAALRRRLGQAARQTLLSHDSDPIHDRLETLLRHATTATGGPSCARLRLG